MGASFSVKSNKVYQCADELRVITGDARDLQNQLENVYRGLRSQSSLRQCSYALNRTIDKLDNEIASIRNMERALQEIVRNYDNTEKRLVNQADKKINSPKKDGNKDAVSGKYWEDESWFTRLMAWLGLGDPFKKNR